MLTAIRACLSVASVIAALAFFTTPASAYDNPYRRIPSSGESVRMDGSVGGESKAWAFYRQEWLERFLRLTIDAANSNAKYSEVQGNIADIAHDVLTFPNGTRATVEDVSSFSYRGRADVEVRLLVSEGNLIGKEVWTTVGELTDVSGHTFVRK